MKWTFFAGLSAGAAIGMLIAPKSGVELRDDIQEFAKENLNREKLESLAEEGRQRIQPLVDEAREKIEPIMSQARDTVQSAVDSAKEHASRMGNNLLDVINEWSHDVFHRHRRHRPGVGVENYSRPSVQIGRRFDRSQDVAA